MGQKSWGTTSFGFEPSKSYIFYNLYRKLYIKSTYFRKKCVEPRSKIFSDNPLINCNKSISSGFEFQHKLYFLSLNTKHYTKIQFLFKKLRPMSMLSYTGGADLGPSRSIPCRTFFALSSRTFSLLQSLRQIVFLYFF